MQVDCDEHKDLAQQYGVSGFPTIKLLKDGKVIDYGGGRTADDIIQYVIKKSGPAAKVCQAFSLAVRHFFPLCVCGFGCSCGIVRTLL